MGSKGIPGLGVSTAYLVFFFSLFLPLLSNAADQKSKASDVLVAVADYRSVNDSIEALGTLKANESVAITVHLAEIVSGIHFDEGQRVEKGDLLVAMEDAEEQAQFQEAEYTLEEANSQLQRIKVIAKRGDASQSLLDERQREYNVAKSRLVAIKSRLQDRKVVAPFSGLVGLRNVSPGAYLAPGDVITTLIDDSTMKLDFDVPAVWLASLQRGMKINATTSAFAGQTFTGNVSTIDNKIDPISRSVKVRALLPNPNGLLKPGLLMVVNLLTNQRQALIVPEEALVPKASRFFAYVLTKQDDQLIAEQREVTIGSRWPGEVEILSGINANEQVVTEGADQLRPGQAVNILKDIKIANQGAG